MSPEELVTHGEHEQEWGGYFVIKGLERLIRMLVMTRRNYPIAVKRSGWKTRGAQFSNLDIGMINSHVSNDETKLFYCCQEIRKTRTQFSNLGCNGAASVSARRLGRRVAAGTALEMAALPGRLTKFERADSSPVPAVCFWLGAIDRDA